VLLPPGRFKFQGAVHSIGNAVAAIIHEILPTNKEDFRRMVPMVGGMEERLFKAIEDPFLAGVAILRAVNEGDYDEDTLEDLSVPPVGVYWGKGVTQETALQSVTRHFSDDTIFLVHILTL
jgi:hypothetical protein